MHVPDDLRYTSDHEWVRQDNGRLIVGITDFAQGELGDIVYVERPALDSSVEQGAPVGEIESTKSVSEIYAPASGRVIAVNDEIADHPELVNEDPYGRGWIFAIEAVNDDVLDALLTPSAYVTLLEEQSSAS